MAVQFFTSPAGLVQWHGGFWVSPDNQPAEQPGVYLLQRFATGKCYVGISQNVFKRCRAHAKFHLRKLSNALRKYGKSAFVIVPIYYSACGIGHLEELEAVLIADFDSAAKGGYNVKLANGHVGPYGPEFSAICQKRRMRRCHNGHLYNEENTITDRRGHRACKSCRKERTKRHYERYGARNNLARALKRRAGRTIEEIEEARLQLLRRLAHAKRGQPLSPKIRAKMSVSKKGRPSNGVRQLSKCRHGHLYTENTVINSRGHRNCKICLAAQRERDKGRKR
jgi:group I intron endonuclease